LSVKQWDSASAAKALDARTAAEIDGFALAAPNDCLREIRVYLQRMTDLRKTTNGAHVLSIRQAENGDSQIDAGPTVFREPCINCIHFRSGADLSFGVTLRHRGGKTTLVSYRFHVQLLSSSGLRFIRIDLNPHKEVYDALRIPRSHMHPGFEGLHIPFPVMRPLEVLDRIFHVIEPHFS
jgi:hypothetical protein